MTGRKAVEAGASSTSSTHRGIKDDRGRLGRDGALLGGCVRGIFGQWAHIFYTYGILCSRYWMARKDGWATRRSDTDGGGRRKSIMDVVGKSVARANPK